MGNINVREIYHNGKIADYVSLQCKAEMKSPPKDQLDNKVLLEWDFRKNSYEKATLQNSLYKDAYIKFRTHIEKYDNYPLLVYYSDRYPHVNTNLGSNVKTLLNENNDIGRNWGYYHWSEFTSCTEIWQKRFIRISNLLLSIERSLNDVEDDGARQTLLKQKAHISCLLYTSPSPRDCS